MVNQDNLQKNLKKINVKKRVLQVCLVVLSIMVLVIVLITLASTVKASNLAFGRYRFYIMKAETKSSIAKKGDFVIAKRMNPGEIKVGDNIVYSENDLFLSSSVVQVENSEKVNNLVIAQENGVSYKYGETDIEGKIVKVIPNLGDVVKFLRTKIGFIFFVLIVICVFLLLRVLLIKKNDYDKFEDNQNNSEKLRTNRVDIDDKE